MILPTAALVTLVVPLVVRENEFEFTTSVLLVRPEVLQTRLEINLMDTPVTALNPGLLAALTLVFLIHPHSHL